MKMLMIIFRESLEQDMLKLLKELEVQAFTELPSVLGSGEAGPVFHTLAMPQTNAMVLSALTDDHAERVIADLRAYRENLTERQSGAYIPLRVFVLPCDQVV